MTKISKRSAASKKAWRTRKKMKVIRSSGNIFKDIGLPNPEQLLLDASKVVRMRKTKNLLPPNPFLEIGDPEKQTLINNDW